MGATMLVQNEARISSSMDEELPFRCGSQGPFVMNAVGCKGAQCDGHAILKVIGTSAGSEVTDKGESTVVV